MRTPRPRARLGWLLVPIAIALLTACQTTTPDATRGRIAGTLSVGATTGQVVAPRSEPTTTDVAPAATGRAARDVRAGEVIVRFHDGVLATASTMTTLSVDGVRLDAVRDLALPGARLYRAPGIDAAATIALAKRLAARPDVRYAQPNAIMRAFQTTPNDEEYPKQWHYDAIRMPEAWDVTTGAGATIVAVVDTGILFRAGDAAASHPDFQSSRMLPGYDFVDPLPEADGPRGDPDPYDEDVDGEAHGTHVAGTIGARTNNGIGTAGIDWSARLLPVRVLGVGGTGTLVDMIDGALWAAGFSVPDVPANANPAHVINLSLGARASCGLYEQEAFDRIATDSPNTAVVVVAAGNGDEYGVGEPVAGTTPASCGNVITVGATDNRNVRASYSNYGPRIDVMAPGGDVDGVADGVLSLGRTAGSFEYTYMAGTSMAAPHVAGVVALMKALEPGLTFEEARAFLVLTATPLSPADCGTGVASDCGAGLIDAAAALVTLSGGRIPSYFAPNPLDFGSDATTLPFVLTNITAEPVAWIVDGYDLLPGNPSDVPRGVVWLVGETEENPSGELAPGASRQFEMYIDRTLLDMPGAYQISLVYLIDGVEQSLAVRFSRSGVSTPTGPTTVTAFTSVGGVLFESGREAAPSFFSTFDFSVPAGDHVVVGWTDDGDGLVNAGDYMGTSSWVRVPPGTRVSGVDIVMNLVVDVESALASAAPWADADALRAALEASGTEAGGD